MLTKPAAAAMQVMGFLAFLSGFAYGWMWIAAGIGMIAWGGYDARRRIALDNARRERVSASE